MKFKFTMERASHQAPATSHFFASSIANWRTGTDLDDLIKTMKKDGYQFNLFYVPVPKDAEYDIKMYAPQVPGAVWLGAYLTQE